MDFLLDALERSDPVLGLGGVVIATLLLLAMLVLVPTEERRLARAPVWFLILHLVLSGVLMLIPEGHSAEQTVQLVGLFLILASIGRSGFVLFVHSFWMRRIARPVPKILRDVIQAFIYVGVALLVLRSAGVEPGSLLATSALLTAVIGLSLQDTLGNLFAGLAIQAQRPFDVGDWVQFDSHPDRVGRVIEINWRATRVTTLEQLEVTVPNAAVAKAPIVNFSRPTAAVRREVDVVAPYDAPPETVVRVLLAAVDHLPDVLREPAASVVTREYTERGVKYTVRYFIDRFERREMIDSHVRERLWYAFRRHGFAIPVPRRRVELVEQPNAEVQREPVFDTAERLLSQIDFFKQLPPEEAEQLARKCQRRRYASEEVIVRRGDASTEMYLIESGRVRIELAAEEGRLRSIAELSRGEFFGEMSLMTGEVRTADVIAAEETVVLVLDRETLAPIIEKYPDFTEHVSQVLAERRARLTELQDNAIEASPDSAHEEKEILQRIRRFFTL